MAITMREIGGVAEQTNKLRYIGSTVSETVTDKVRRIKQTFQSHDYRAREAKQLQIEGLPYEIMPSRYATQIKYRRKKLMISLYDIKQTINQGLPKHQHLDVSMSYGGNLLFRPKYDIQTDADGKKSLIPGKQQYQTIFQLQKNSKELDARGEIVKERFTNAIKLINQQTVTSAIVLQALNGRTTLNITIDGQNKQINMIELMSLLLDQKPKDAQLQIENIKKAVLNAFRQLVTKNSQNTFQSLEQLKQFCKTATAQELSKDQLKWANGHQRGVNTRSQLETQVEPIVTKQQVSEKELVPEGYTEKTNAVIDKADQYSEMIYNSIDQFLKQENYPDAIRTYTENAEQISQKHKELIALKLYETIMDMLETPTNRIRGIRISGQASNILSNQQNKAIEMMIDMIRSGNTSSQQQDMANAA